MGATSWDLALQRRRRVDQPHRAAVRARGRETALMASATDTVGVARIARVIDGKKDATTPNETSV
jgi:hypothetical protein